MEFRFLTYINGVPFWGPQNTCVGTPLALPCPYKVEPAAIEGQTLTPLTGRTEILYGDISPAKMEEEPIYSISHEPNGDVVLWGSVARLTQEEQQRKNKEARDALDAVVYNGPKVILKEEPEDYDPEDYDYRLNPAGDLSYLDGVQEEPRARAVNPLLATAIELGNLVVEKNRAYGDSFRRAGDFLKMLYPNGVEPPQYQDMLAIVRCFDKFMRIATDKDAFGESPWKDVVGYGILSATYNQEDRDAAESL